MPGYVEIPKLDLIVGWTEKAGCTTIMQSLKHGRIQGARAGRPIARCNVGSRPVRLYLRHPLKRLASAYMYFRHHQFPHGTQIAADISFRHFIDAVLRGVSNEHWSPQLPQHSLIEDLTCYRLETIADTWPVEVPLMGPLNSSGRSKPPLAYRRDELEALYVEDLTAWEKAR